MKDNTENSEYSIHGSIWFYIGDADKCENPGQIIMEGMDYFDGYLCYITEKINYKNALPGFYPIESGYVLLDIQKRFYERLEIVIHQMQDRWGKNDKTIRHLLLNLEDLKYSYEELYSRWQYEEKE